MLIQYLHSIDAGKLQGNWGIQKIIAAKKESEENYQKVLDAFVITNSKSFEESAVEYAKNNNIKLVSLNDLINPHFSNL